MADADALAAELRGVAFAVAYRMLGDPADAEDIAQQSTMRWLETDRATVERPAAFIASIAARLTLNFLRNRKGQRRLMEQFGLPTPLIADQALAADWRLDVSYGVVLLTRSLSPAARAVFILRNAFDLSFEEIGGYLGKSAAACRQINGRAAKTLEAVPRGSQVPPEDMGTLVSAILAEDVPAVARLLADDVILLTDGGQSGPDIGKAIGGRDRIAKLLSVSPALLGDALVPRIIVTPSGTVLVIEQAGELAMTVVAERHGPRITRVYVLSDRKKFERLDGLSS